LWDEQVQTDPSGFALVVFSNLPEPFDLQPGNYVTVADDDLTKGLVLLPMSVTVFDTNTDYMEGTAPAGADVWVAAGLQESQEGTWVNADATTGVWYAYFAFDITEDMRGWSYAQMYDVDGDVNEADPPW
jgi:hypothetical protein